ncbi:hypothetical protein F4801DRAFT_604599 [Xylaria longipes]|nr:hypothetical protein F4801DRAFT_604599 [Xylaria longipes]
MANPGFVVDKAKFDALDKRVKDLKKLDNSKLVIHADVLIVGSGPIGAVYARTLINHEGQKDPKHPKNPGFKVGKVLMIDMGAQESLWAGEHHKNSVVVQKDLSLFTNKRVHFGNHNPQQKPEYNIPASAATRIVGGMSTHWTACTPRQHPHERSKLFTDHEWDSLYGKCEALFSTSNTTFDNSVRHRLVKYVVKNRFQRDFEHGHKRPRQTGPRKVEAMPLAVKQNSGNKSYLTWSCTATILGDLASPSPPDDRFKLMSQHQCDVLFIKDGKVSGAVIIDLVSNREYVVEAKKYVICGGAVLTAGIMAKSVIESGLTLDEFCPTLGKYMTEQPMTFCRVILKQQLIDDVRDDPGFLDNPNDDIIAKKVNEHTEKYPDDPIPFPFDDFDPQVYTPFSNDYPWHTQINRDAYGYADLPPDVDSRLVVDLRFFSLIEAREANKVTWDPANKDVYGMLQPTFWFQLTEHDKSQVKKMKEDMTHVAKFLGDFVPGEEPQDLELGRALHICGTYRAGEKPGPNKKPPMDSSVVSREGKVWNMDNLYLGGCGIIPVSNASNPTLTAACHALAGANQIIEELKH